MTELLLLAEQFRLLRQRTMKPLATRHGLTLMELEILLFLRNNPTLNTARDIVRLRAFAKSNVSNSVEQLRARGLLAVAPDPESRRVVRLYLQPAAEPVLAEALAAQERNAAAVLKGFTPQELQILADHQRRIAENVRHILNDGI